MVEHHPSASNKTYLDEEFLDKAKKITDGSKLQIGRSGKCPLKVIIKTK